MGLLKVDVEGHELAVFEGAKRLLESQGVDVIYVEAGVNPEGDHHCYYRDMEDYLREYGYRLFKIYEQKNEWLDDSPLLRRINLAFLSEAFAAANPYKVTRQLFQSRSREAALADELAALKEQEARRAVEEEEKLEALRGELAARVSQVTKLTKQLEVAQRVHSETVGKHQAAIADYRAALDQAKADVSGLSAELSKKNADIVTLHQQLETEYRKHVGAVAARDFKIGEIRAALEETRNQVAVLQAELRDRVKEIVAITRQAEADRRLFFEAIAARDAQLEKAETRMAKLRGEMVDLSQRVEQLARHNESLLQSTSWRITAPLRHAVLWMRKLSRRRTFAVPGLSRTGEVEETRPN